MKRNELPTPAEIAGFSVEQVRDIPPALVKKLTNEHYAVMSSVQIETLFPPIKIGPTWATNPDGSWQLPEHTLGWQIAGWCSEWLRGDDNAPWTFTMEQLRFILHWYAVDANGRFPNRTGVLQRMKGWGKDPLLAVICLVEMVGPSRFDYWDESGEPVGKAHPKAWVQIAAVSRDQTKNTMTLFPALMSDEFKAKYRIQDGIELIRGMGGRVRLEAVTSSYRSLEGGRITFTVLNETHHWVQGNNGQKMHETIDGNATKVDSRYLAITNAYLPGEDSVAQNMRESYDKIVEGKLANTGVMYDSLEAHPSSPLAPAALPTLLKLIRGDASWLNIESIIASIMNATISASRSRRMWLNQIVAEEDALYGPELWDPLARPDAALAAGDEIVMGFDGGKTDDSTALVAIRVRDRTVFPLGIWEKPDGPAGKNWEINRDLVDSTVRETFLLYTVLGFYADVALWESYIAEWERDKGEGLVVKASGFSIIGWDMRQSQKLVTRAHERLMRAIFDGKLFHNADRTLRRHTLNARRRSNNYGISFGKESRESPKKVDAYAALLLAFECLHDFDTRTKTVKKKTGRGYFI